CHRHQRREGARDGGTSLKRLERDRADSFGDLSRDAAEFSLVSAAEQPVLQYDVKSGRRANEILNSSAERINLRPAFAIVPALIDSRHLVNPISVPCDINRLSEEGDSIGVPERRRKWLPRLSVIRRPHDSRPSRGVDPAAMVSHQRIDGAYVGQSLPLCAAVRRSIQIGSLIEIEKPREHKFRIEGIDYDRGDVRESW